MPTKHDSGIYEAGFFGRFQDSVSKLEARVRLIEQDIRSIQTQREGITNDRCNPRGTRLTSLERTVGKLETDLALLQHDQGEVTHNQDKSHSLFVAVIAALVGAFASVAVTWLRGPAG